MGSHEDPLKVRSGAISPWSGRAPATTAAAPQPATYPTPAVNGPPAPAVDTVQLPSKVQRVLCGRLDGARSATCVGLESWVVAGASVDQVARQYAHWMLGQGSFSSFQ